MTTVEENNKKFIIFSNKNEIRERRILEYNDIQINKNYVLIKGLQKEV